MFGLTEEQRSLQELVRDFAQGEIRPLSPPRPANQPLLTAMM